MAWSSGEEELRMAHEMHEPSDILLTPVITVLIAQDPLLMTYYHL